MRFLASSLKVILATAAVALASAAPAFADTVAYSDTAGSGNQTYTGNLALNFQVNNAIIVDQLGVFNTHGTTQFSAGGPITVGIYNSIGTLLASATFLNGTIYSLVGGDLFQTITPLYLAPGTYQVDAVGFNATNQNGNITISGSGPTLNTGAGALTFLGAAYDASTTLNHPTTCVGCATGVAQTKQFDAGTFAYTVTPEPSSLLLLGTGLLSLGAIARRRISA